MTESGQPGSGFDPLVPPMGDSKKRYDAFISYSHAADGAFAPSLQDGLHKLAKPWKQRRALEVFRDETGLSVNPALWTSICAAMDGADYFVLLASPEAAKSEWVGREIQRWLATKGPETIIPVITSGDWVWDSERNDFDVEWSDALHPSLAGAFWWKPKPFDMSWVGSDESLTVQHSRFREQLAEIAAPMHGVETSQLLAEDARQRRRTSRMARGAVSLLTLLTLAAVSAGILALISQRQAASARDQAVASREEAEHQANLATSRALASRALDTAEGDGDLALLLAAQADQFASTEQSEGALDQLLDTSVVRHLQGGSGNFVDAELSLDGSKVAAADGDGTVLAWDTATGATLFDPKPGDAADVAWSADGSELMVTDLNDVIRFYGDAGKPSGEPLRTAHAPVVQATPGTGPGGIGACRDFNVLFPQSCLEAGELEIYADLDPTGELVMIYQPAGGLEVWDRASGETIANPNLYTGMERFDNESGLLLLDQETLDARTGASTPRPTGGSQTCATVNSYTGIQVYEPKSQRWAVATLTGGGDEDGVFVAAYHPDQGPANNPRLECFPADTRGLQVRLTASARTIDMAQNGLIAVGTAQDALVLIDSNEGPPHDDPIEAACAAAGRSLTEEEWAQFIPGTDYRTTCPGLVGGFATPDPPDVAADTMDPPTPGQIRAALTAPDVTYLGPCERTAYTFELTRVVYCGSLSGNAPGEAVFAMNDGEDPRTAYVHFTVEGGEWVEEARYVPAPDDPPADAPEWFNRLTEEGDG
ncbi:MAG: toll/interleukin-1 receptor domain-containing protein [Microthrixaceae bacterium]